MKSEDSLKNAVKVLLIAIPLLILVQTQVAHAQNSSALSETKIIVAKNSTTPDEQWDSFKVDGNSSASKLVVKRSHSVSEQDEAGLAIFLGIIVIGVIVFFLNPFGEKK